MSAKTAKIMVELFVDKTFNDHHAKNCVGRADPDEPCIHEWSGTLEIARELEAGFKIGQKRATLDIRCPYSTEDHKKHHDLLLKMVVRILQLPEGLHRQQVEAIQRVATEITRYAERNAMQVIAEAAL